MVFGIIIIIAGLAVFLQVTYGVSIDIWPIILVIVGILIIIGALSSRRRYLPSSTPQAT